MIGKSVVVATAVLALALAVGAKEAGASLLPANIVVNGGFQDNMDEWQNLTAYSSYDADVDHFGNASSGSVFFQVTHEQIFNASVRQCVRMAPGIPLTLGAKALLPTALQAPGASAHISVQFYVSEECDGGQVGNDSHYVSPGSNWQHLEIDTVTPAGTGSAMVYVGVAKGIESAIPAYGHIDAVTVYATTDTDDDGCIDGQELLQNPGLGGDRNPADGWDFFDAPAPALLDGALVIGSRNQMVTLSDVLAIVAFVGAADGGPTTANGADYDSDRNANGIQDGQEYDRAPSSDPAKPWRSGPPSGLVTLSDALVALQQVGHSCA